MRKKVYFNQFSRWKKKLKNGHAWPPIHKSKLNFSCLSSGHTKFSKSFKTIMSLLFLALKARKAGNRPGTFYTGLTVNSFNFFINFSKVGFKSHPFFVIKKSNLTQHPPLILAENIQKMTCFLWKKSCSKSFLWVNIVSQKLHQCFCEVSQMFVGKSRKVQRTVIFHSKTENNFDWCCNFSVFVWWGNSRGSFNSTSYTRERLDILLLVRQWYPVVFWVYYSPNVLFGSVEISQLWLGCIKKLRALYEV